ncbi:MAG: hypothetical protein H5U32_03935 [Pseudomonas balearica]|uniref:hypothetical protein n=1 Tax=Stutzerimonas balearica TaxID=74829 RepID=UPI0019CF2414|nr:hypothetical protein [Stutzerimonas balearica]MBC7198382.1 hypothetical protein [Stutzerimonas balearica]
MGQAKNRGSLEQRIEQAKAERAELAEKLGLEKRTIGEIKSDLGLPEDARFHGYAVHNPEKDDFLSIYSDTKDAITKQWVNSPAGAKCFEDFVDAYKLARADHGEIVVGVFETDYQWLVADVLGE